jgi:choline kinase
MPEPELTAVILAAGGGTRIAEITSAPKVLLRLGAASLLERHLCILRDLEVRRVLVVVGYQREKVIRAARPFSPDLDIQFVDNDDYTAMGNGYSFYLGIQRAPGSVLVFDGDVIYDPAILRRFQDSDAESAVLVGHGSLDDDECAKVLVDAQGLCRMTVDKRPVTDSELAIYRFVGECVGILRFGAEDRQALVDICRTFFADERHLLLNWEKILNQFLPRRQIPFHFEESERWTEVDTPEDYRRALELFGR